LSSKSHLSLLEVLWRLSNLSSKVTLPQENAGRNTVKEKTMTTKYEDASSIVGSTFAAKLAAYEEKLRKKERHKSEADVLILKSRAQSRILDLVEKYNLLLGVATSAKRTREDAEDIVRGYGNWHQKEAQLKLVVRALIEDLDNMGLLEDQRVRKALHRQVHSLKKYAQRVHTECLVEEYTNAQREIAHIAADVRMRRVLGLR